MASAFWEEVAAEGRRVPGDRSLAELTTELTAMLGDPDPYVRDDIAFTTLSAWIAEGVYDDLLEGLGDGMAAGLVIGLGAGSADSVFRRSYSARVLADCIRRDNVARLLPSDTLMRWGDQVMSWLVRERDLRAYVPGRGRAGCVRHGAAALEALSSAEAIGRLELTVLLDVVADRLTAPTETWFTYGEDDWLAWATMAVLRRDAVPMSVLDPWLARLAEAALPEAPPPEPGEGAPSSAVSANVQSFLRALHLQLALAPRPPACRADLLLSLISVLRTTNPALL